MPTDPVPLGTVAVNRGRERERETGKCELFCGLGRRADSSRGRASVVVPVSLRSSIELHKILFCAEECKHDFSYSWVRSEHEFIRSWTNAPFPNPLHKSGYRQVGSEGKGSLALAVILFLWSISFSCWVWNKGIMPIQLTIERVLPPTTKKISCESDGEGVQVPQEWNLSGSESSSCPSEAKVWHFWLKWALQCALGWHPRQLSLCEWGG